MVCDRYIVKPMEKIVVGIKDHESASGIWEEVFDTMNKDYALTVSNLILSKNLDITTPIRGVAVCKEGDMFSIDVGKNIVDLKTNYKYHKAMKRRYIQLERHLMKILTCIKKLADKHERKEIAYERKIDKFMTGD